MDKQKKDRQVKFRVSRDELEALRAEAERRKLPSVPALARKLVMRTLK